MNDKLYKQYANILDKTIIPSNISKEEVQVRIAPLSNWITKHTPRKLYKFRKCNSQNIDAFRNKQVWFATGARMNDDFDGRLYCDKELLKKSWELQKDSDGILKQIKMLQSAGLPAKLIDLFSADVVAQIQNNFKQFDWTKFNREVIQLVEKLMEAQLPFINQSQQNLLFSSFSEDIGSPAMWGYYAENSTGFALAYDFRNKSYNDNNIALNSLLPVVYNDEIIDATEFAGYIMQYTIAQLAAMQVQFPMGEFNRVIHNFVQCSDSFMQMKIISHKSLLWAHEKEWRMTLIRLPNVLDKSSVQKSPCALYLGRKIKDTDELILRNIAYQQRIPVFKMAIDDSSKEYRLKAIRQQNTRKQLLLK